MHKTGNGAAAAPDSRLVDRMLFFSDAVFAIVLTLLVLELRPPAAASEADFVAALTALTPKFIAFAASFALVSIFWAAHMAITRRLTTFDWTSAWLNLLFLFTIAVMPFASALLGTQGNRGISWRIYCAALVAASLAQTMFVFALTRDKGRLVGGIGWREKTWRVLRSLSPGIAFGTGLWLSYEGETRYSALCWLLIPILLIFAQLFFGPRRT
jgi:uncharacterized membrane protein